MTGSARVSSSATCVGALPGQDRAQHAGQLGAEQSDPGQELVLAGPALGAVLREEQAHRRVDERLDPLARRQAGDLGPPVLDQGPHQGAVRVSREQPSRSRPTARGPASVTTGDVTVAAVPVAPGDSPAAVGSVAPASSPPGMVKRVHGCS